MSSASSTGSSHTSVDVSNVNSKVGRCGDLQQPFQISGENCASDAATVCVNVLIGRNTPHIPSDVALITVTRRAETLLIAIMCTFKVTCCIKHGSLNICAYSLRINTQRRLYQLKIGDIVLKVESNDGYVLCFTFMTDIA